VAIRRAAPGSTLVQSANQARETGDLATNEVLDWLSHGVAPSPARRRGID